ncbi:MAG TPA: hypothetical protein PLC98_20740, partial [Anaerolineales bacterium]|nr:hypothetical protein [Anaerolineales bacterium]
MSAHTPLPGSPARRSRPGPSALVRIAISLIGLTLLSPMAAPIDVPAWFAQAREALAAQPQNLPTADAALRRAAERLPYDGLTRYRAGQVALANGDADAALAYFEAAFAVLDVGAAQYLALGDAYQAQGRRAEAVTA